MTNAYNNQANNVPPQNTKIAVGMKVQTPYGIGVITDVIGHFQGYDSINTPLNTGLIATILVPIPGKQPLVFQQNFNTVVFTSNVGGEATISAQYDNNL